jgi:hypothetical protein
MIGEDSAEREKEKGRSRRRRREGDLLRGGERKQFYLDTVCPQSIRQQHSSRCVTGLRSWIVQSREPNTPVRVLTLLLFITMYIF